MLLPSMPLSVALALSLSWPVFAAPQMKSSAGQVMGLKRRSPSDRTVEEWGIWAKNHKAGLEAKYGAGQPQKRRSTGTNLITNQNSDSSYFGSLAIGTPAVSFDVILDTGSADLWVAGSTCQTGCQDVPTFDPTASTSFQNQSTTFSITYGSGQASGALAKDVIQMAGFSVTNQVFAVCDQISSGLLNSPVSGLLGLGFQSIASSKATPFWQTLVSNGAWTDPLMAFYLTRYINQSNAQSLEFGGSFTMGFTNTSLYTGEIEYIDLPTSGSYWILPLSTMTVQGTQISLPSGSASYAAIDTGTTLVGGPSQYIAEIFAQIPGSTPGTGNFQSYYTYPCSTSVSVQLSFGGKNWTISPQDFQLSQLTKELCLGAFFELTTGGSAPSWIVGDTFLKNVYSVFRYNPASVGFAKLSDFALASSGSTTESVPSATIGSAGTSVSATGRSPTRSTSDTISDIKVSRTSIVSIAVFWTIMAIAGLLI